MAASQGLYSRELAQHIIAKDNKGRDICKMKYKIFLANNIFPVVTSNTVKVYVKVVSTNLSTKQ